MKFIRLLHLLMAFCCWGSIIIGQSDSFVVALTAANQQIKQGNYTQSIQILDRIRPRIPTSSLADQLDFVELSSITYQALGQFDSAFHFTQKFIQLAQQQNDSLRQIDAYNDFAIIHHDRMKLDTALHYYRRALQIAKNLQIPDRISLLSNNIGIIFGQQGVVDHSLSYFEQGLAIATTIKDTILIEQALTNIGRWHIEFGNLQDGVDTLLTAKAYSEALNNKSGLISILNFLGLAYSKQGKFEASHSSLQEALMLSEEPQFLFEKARISVLLGTILGQMEEYDQALHSISAGLAIAQQEEFKKVILEAFQALSSVYEAKGAFKKALMHEKEYNILYQEIFSENANNRQAEEEAIFQIGLKELENEKLKQQATAKEILVRNQKLLIFAIMLILLLVSIIALVLFRNHRKINELNQGLEAAVSQKTEELQRSNQELIQSNNELQSFAYMASHDMKEPLRNINSYAALLKRKIEANLDTQGMNFLENIRRSARNLHHLVEDVLLFSLHSNQNQKIEEVDFNKLMPRVEEACQRWIQEKGGIINYKELPIIKGNSNQWFMILKNLVENGLKYNKHPKPCIQIEYHKNAHHHQLIISDNGIGIDKKYHQQIFDLFKRLHTRAEIEGTGLGLATCKKFLEQMGGQIYIESELGKGSIFYCEWPLYDS